MGEIAKALGIEPQTIVIQFIGFVIVAGLVWKYLLPKIDAILTQRSADIQATYDQLDHDRRRMEDARLEYERRLHAIEEEAREHIQASLKEAQVLRDNLVAEAEKQAASIIQRGRAESEQERERAFVAMRQQIVALTVAAAGKVIGRSLDESTHGALVDRFIDDVSSGRQSITANSGGRS